MKTGTIAFFDASSGIGCIRGHDGGFIHFYACNVVGADNVYPHLVGNVFLSSGDAVSYEGYDDEFSSDPLGAVSIKPLSPREGSKSAR